MNRPIRALAALSLFAAGPLLAADATVEFKDDKGKPGRVEGPIEEETPAGIKVKGTFVATGNMTKISYALPGALKLSNPVAKAADMEAAGDWDKALKEYETALKEAALSDAQWKSARRHIEFRVVVDKAMLAEANPGEGNANAKAAADGLEKFVKDHAASWQVVPAGKTLGTLQMGLGQLDKAAKTFDDLTKLPGVDGSAKLELQSLNIDALMAAGKFADAEKKVGDLDRAMKPDDPRKPRVQVYRIGCTLSTAKPQESMASLRQIIGKANDPSVLALAYNTLGDCYRVAKNPAEARWQYLIVDQVYNGDKAEHAKACERLAEVFKELNEDGRAEEYKTKAQRLR